jgi:putative nucleotidyltransferase with HDIG domain
MLTCSEADGDSPACAALPEAVRAYVEQRIADGRLELPMLPHVASRILAGGLDESTAIRELSALLHRDQALAGHVLRVANSAAYARGARIQSIQQGLIRIGLAQLREIVVAVALQSRVFRADGYEDIVGGLWTHSAVAGAYAKEIARRLRFNVESAFVCGLLHDVGKPVVLTLMQDLGGDGGEAPSRRLCLEALAVYHTSVGRRLAEHWSLPDAMRESIALHHDFERAERHVQAVRITCLANLLSHLALAGDDARAYDEAGVRSHPVCAALNLYPDDVDQLVARRAAMLEQAEAFSP